MAAATPLPTRQRLIEEFSAGTSKAALARDFSLAYGTVHTICRRFAAEGEAGLRPRYERCGPQRPRSDALYQRAACWLKRRHQQWGAPLIRLLLQRRYAVEQAERPIPSARTLQRWFRSAGLTQPRSHPPRAPKQWATAVHDVWQVDAKERQQTADRHRCCWLTVTDEHSTAILAAPVFPLADDLAGPAAAAAGGAASDLPAMGTPEGAARR